MIDNGEKVLQLPGIHPQTLNSHPTPRPFQTRPSHSPPSQGAAAAVVGGHAVTLDVTDPATVSPDQAVDQIPSTVDVDMVRRVFETNVFGVITVTNAMLPLLRRAPAARIVNVSSAAGSLTIAADPDGPLAGLPGSAAYTPSKTALNALTVQYANELRKDGILVNTAYPGYVDTDINNHTGFLTTAQGAAVVVRLAMLGADGPTGGFFGAGGPVPW